MLYQHFLKITPAFALLTEQQALEFDRIAKVYQRVYNYLIDGWGKHVQSKPQVITVEHAATFLKTKVKNLLSFAPWIAEEERSMAFCAMFDALRAVMDAYNSDGSCPSARAVGEKKVVFYKQYDVKLRLNQAMLPFLGIVKTTRFAYFEGSIRGVGIEKTAGAWACNVYYVDNRTLEKERAEKETAAA